jgi:hypothetical protein
VRRLAWRLAPPITSSPCPTDVRLIEPGPRVVQQTRTDDREDTTDRACQPVACRSQVYSDSCSLQLRVVAFRVRAMRGPNAGLRLSSLVVVSLLGPITMPWTRQQQVLASSAGPGSAPRLDDDLAVHFLRNPKRAYAMRAAKKANKPLMVILTQRDCSACHHLLQSINDGTQARDLLPRFIGIHVDRPNAWKAWKRAGHDYMPQTLFFPPGEKEMLPILGTSDESPHYLHDEDTVVWGMQTCLEAVASGARWNTEGLEEQVRQDAIDKLGWGSANDEKTSSGHASTGGPEASEL